MGGVGPFRPGQGTAEKPLPDADNFGFAGIDLQVKRFQAFKN